MTTEQYWQQLDALAASKDTSNALLEAAELLRANPTLPLLISCRRAHGRIQHLFTTFDERNPDATGNRYLICFTSEKQAKRTPPPPIADEAHEAGPSFENLDERYGKRRKKGSNATWTITAGETARVSTGKVLAYMRRSKAVGGLIFNPGDDRHSLAIAKFLLE